MSQLNDKESEIQSTNRINEELQEKFKQSEAKLSTLEKRIQILKMISRKYW